MRQDKEQHEEIDPDEIDDDAVTAAWADLAKSRGITQKEPIPPIEPEKKAS